MGMKHREELDGRGLPIYEPWHLTTVQTHLVAASGEFVGTFFFLFFGYSGHLMVINEADSTVETPGVIQTVFVGYAYGFSLLVTVWAFYRISGGLFNPAVSWTQSLLRNQLMTDLTAGDSRLMHGRPIALDQSSIPHSNPAHCIHVCGRGCGCHVPRRHWLNQHSHWPRGEYCASIVCRNVFHELPRLRYPYACHRKVARHVPCANWNWIGSVCRRNTW